MIGRPTKLTPELQEAICEHLRSGNLLQVAAQAEGIDRATLWRWRKRGEAGEAPFDVFCNAVERAMAEAECEMVERLKRLGTESGKSSSAMVRATSWILERTRRERYGPSVTLKVEEAKEKLLDVAERVLASADFAALLHELANDSTAETGDAEEQPVATDLN
jgi:transposase-like protein